MTISAKGKLGVGALMIAGIVLLVALFGIPQNISAWFGGMAAMVFVCFGLVQFYVQSDRRARLCFGLFGIMLLFSTALGYQLEKADQTGWKALTLCLLFACCWGPAVGGFGLLACRKLSQTKQGKEVSRKKVFWVCFTVLLICWLPVQLAFYPCLYGYDLNSQVLQVVNNSYTAHHPLLHTLLVGGLYMLGKTLGNPTAGALAYAIIQMVCLAGAMAWAISYLSSLHAPRWVLVGITMLFALLPSHSLMSIAATKDVLFAAVMTVCLVQIHKLLCAGQTFRCKAMLSAGVWMVLACLLRNNAWIAIALFFAVWIVFFAHGNRRRVMVLAAIVLLLQAAVSGGLRSLTKAEKGLINEMLSVPAQQLSRVYIKHGFDVPTGYEVVEWVPHAGSYQPDLSDFTKLHLRVRREGELIGFLKFWIREFFHFPIEYIDAFLLNTKGYWFLRDSSFASVYDSGVGAIIIEQYHYFDIEYRDLLPWLSNKMHKLFSENQYIDHVCLSTLIHPATYTWSLLFCLTWATWKKRKDVMTVGLLMLCYLLTLFLGPCALLRYIYYLMIVVPVLVGILMLPSKN